MREFRGVSELGQGRGLGGKALLRLLTFACSSLRRCSASSALRRPKAILLSYSVW